MCSTPLGIIGLVITCSFHCINLKLLVLNASRHHRIGHTLAEKYDELAHLRCSTPLGIIGLVIFFLVGVLSAGSVLNASRHHRIGHFYAP